MTATLRRRGRSRSSPARGSRFQRSCPCRWRGCDRKRVAIWWKGDVRARRSSDWRQHRRNCVLVKPPDVQYARSGELSIAYQVVGEGPLDFVFVPPTSHLELAWESPAQASSSIG